MIVKVKPLKLKKKKTKQKGQPIRKKHVATKENI